MNMSFKNQARLRDTFKQFCECSSISSLKYMVNVKRPKIERVIWLVVHIFIFAITSYIISFAWYFFMDKPTVTTLETGAYSIGNVPFPGVSICNINKISKKRAWKFAKELANRTGKNAVYLLEQIKSLGNMYHFEVEGYENFAEFQSILDVYDHPNNFEPYNPYYRLYKLMTPCSELLEKCYWKGKRRNCTDLFASRRTHEGYCCIFNYMRPAKSYHQFVPQQKQVYKTDIPGVSGGLSVVIKNDPDDYFYPLMASVGVHIFNAFDYPDVTSGGLMECLVSMGFETFLKVSATTVFAVDEIRRYPIQKRKCIFDDEASTIFGGYTYSNCMVDCKTKTMLALCQCIPFMLPVDMQNPCTLVDLSCLSKYRTKWLTVYPVDSDDEELSADKEDSLFCSRMCSPLCSTTLYSVNTNVAPLKVGGLRGANHHKHNYVHVFFGQQDSVLYKHDAVYYWFEILSNFGGLFGLFLGLSLISVIELFYFIIVHFMKKISCFTNCKRNKKVSRHQK